MRDLVITLIEVGNSESPNIGTIVSSGDQEDLDNAIRKAIESHFDNELTGFKISNGLIVEDVRNSCPIDAVAVFADGYEAQIEIQQTWLY